MTSTNIHFMVYETGKQMEYVKEDSYLGKIVLGCVAGISGAACGIPTDLINVRMQTDMKVPPEQRRKYFYPTFELRPSILGILSPRFQL